jgi:hypothetical protein
MVAPAIIYIAPGAYITTAAQVRTLLESNPANLTAVLAWSAVRADVSSDAQRGYTYGFTEIRVPGGTIVPGKYIAYWKRQSNGAWKLAAYRRNVRPAGVVSLTPPAGFETPDYHRYFPKTDAASELASVFATDQAFRTRRREASAPHLSLSPRRMRPCSGARLPLASERKRSSRINRTLSRLALWSPSFGDAAETGDLAFTTGFALKDSESRRHLEGHGAGKVSHDLEEAAVTSVS